MRFCWSTLNVRNLEESVKFYTDIIGLEVARSFSAGPLNIAFLGKEGTEIELIYDEKNQDIDVGKDISWGFEVESLEYVLGLVRANNIIIEAGPIQPTPDVRFAFIKDPNGMKIQLVENVKK